VRQNLTMFLSLCVQPAVGQRTANSLHPGSARGLGPVNGFNNQSGSAGLQHVTGLPPVVQIALVEQSVEADNDALEF
jgi:hypothetical protein